MHRYHIPVISLAFGDRRCELHKVGHFFIIIFLFSELKLILLEKMTNEIPVISVISIMGTTEESAVDPLEDIFTIRAELSKMEKVYYSLRNT